MTRLSKEQKRMLETMRDSMFERHGKPSVSQILESVRKLADPQPTRLKEGTLCVYQGWDDPHGSDVEATLLVVMAAPDLSDEPERGDHVLLTQYDGFVVTINRHILNYNHSNRLEVEQMIKMFQELGVLSHAKYSPMDEAIFLFVHGWKVLCPDGNIRSVREDLLRAEDRFLPEDASDFE